MSLIFQVKSGQGHDAGVSANTKVAKETPAEPAELNAASFVLFALLVLD